MDKERLEKKKPWKPLIFAGKAIPVPPDQRQPVPHLPTEEQIEARHRRLWCGAIGATFGGLIVGMLIGRFLIP